MLQAVLSKENLEQAFRRVMENKGVCGVDGVGASTFRSQLQAEWKTIKGQIESRSYKPRAVQRVLIPKSNGDQRPLGIPTYMDRFIQQSISQILTPIYDPDFSANSFGFRSERNAQQAVKKAQSYINEGYSHVVDIDLAKFFDKVNHDYLMNELSLRIQDKLLLRLIHLLVRADIQQGDEIIKCKEGLPQGGPLSPLLSNIILDKLDKELEARGHRFVRYADDCSIYVKTPRAGERVMKSISDFIQKKLKLEVNQDKSDVHRPGTMKILGFTFYYKKGSVGLTVHRKSWQSYKDKVRKITSRSKPMSMEMRLMELRWLNRGWGNYFKISDSRKPFKEADKWVRSRLRLCLWKQWKLPKTKVKELTKLGIAPYQAYQWGNTRKGYWRTVHSPILTRCLSNKRLKEMGFLSLIDVVTPFATVNT